jgi:hypothetical protein
MREACGNCTWFKAEPETLMNPNAPVAIDHETKTMKHKSALDGGSRPPVYGKCGAVFQDVDNKTQVYEFGTFSSSDCRALDDSGYKLFKVG